MHCMITKHEDLLGTLIHDVAHLLRLAIDRRLSVHNLTRVKWLALGIIDHNSPVTQSELATELELGEASVGRLVDRLVDRGFVVRKKHPEDRRSHQLLLTDHATDLLRDLDGTAAEIRKETLHSFSEKEIAELNSGLLKLKENLKAKAQMCLVALCIASQKISGGVESIWNLAATL
jgi:DNA-binding MarR family transcriptional regulator